jgi:hypothetical protein
MRLLSIILLRKVLKQLTIWTTKATSLLCKSKKTLSETFRSKSKRLLLRFHPLWKAEDSTNVTLLVTLKEMKRVTFSQMNKNKMLREIS